MSLAEARVRLAHQAHNAGQSLARVAQVEIAKLGVANLLAYLIG